MLRQNGMVDLAERAYANAFEAEPTNAQILWDHAQLLKQHGKREESRELLRRLATGKWQPRFHQIQSQARQAGVE